MNILINAPYYPITKKKTVGTWAHNQARALQSIGNSVDVVSPSPYVPDIPFFEYPDNVRRWADLPGQRYLDGVTVYYPKTPVIQTDVTNTYLWKRYPSIENKTTWIFVRGLMERLVSENRYDGILCHNPIPAAYIGEKIKLKADCPLTLMLHSYDDLQNALKNPRTERFYSEAISSADTVATVSQKMVEKASEIVDREYEIIRNGFDTDEVSKAKNVERPSPLVSGKTVACVGSFNERKGQEVLIDAVHQLASQESSPEFDIVLVGDGPRKAAIREKVEKYGLSDRVTIESNLTRNELNLLFRDSYLFALPSWNEPCAVVYSEVMPYGTTIIATEGEGFSELIIDGENGCLVERENPTDLAETLKWLIENEDTAKAIGERGRSFVESNLTWEHNAKQVEDSFKRGKIATR